jgi:hypothetical protein
MRLQCTVVLCATLLITSFGRPLHAQQILCVAPAEPANPSERCTLSVPPGQSSQPIEVRLAEPQEGVTINFKIATGTNGNLSLASVHTDRNGRATIVWSGQAGDQPMVIRAESPSGVREIEVKLKPTPGVTNRQLVLDPPRRVPHWFVQRQLTDSTRVFVSNPTDDCGSNVVAFIPTPGDGTVSADSVRPTMEAGACVATTWWTLGSNVGRQHLRALLADERSKAVSVTAIGRALPRLGAGLVVGYDHRSYQTLKDTTLVIHVTHTVGDSLTIAQDSLVTRHTVSDVDSKVLIDPAIITDFPIVPQARWLRGMVGVSAKSPDRDFYLGFSALQPIYGVTREGVGFDVQFVVHAGRREVLSNRSCTSDMVLDDCKMKDKFFPLMGFGFAGFVDGSNIITTITSIFK